MWLVEQIKGMNSNLGEPKRGALRPVDPNQVIPLPSKFRMPEMDKFDGTACPKTHADTYIMGMRAKGASPQQMADHFHLSLRGTALKWFLSLKPENRTTWDQIIEEFLEKYRANLEWETNRQDLISTEQRDDESVSDFYKRWNWKLSEVMQPISKEEQLSIFRTCIKTSLRNVISHHYYPDLRALVDAGSMFEKTLKATPPSQSTPYRYRTLTPVTAPSTGRGKETSGAVHFIQDGQQSQNNPRNDASPAQQRSRNLEFSGMPLSKVLEGLMRENLLQPLENYKPKFHNPNLDANKRCTFHNYHGHTTDNCTVLRQAVQDLIDQGKIEPLKCPNTVGNPFSNNQINTLEFDETANMKAMDFIGSSYTFVTEMNTPYPRLGKGFSSPLSRQLVDTLVKEGRINPVLRNEDITRIVKITS